MVNQILIILQMKMNKNIFGTQEWAAQTENIINGCSNNCKYCYAKEIAIRFKRKTTNSWSEEELNFKKLNRNILKRTDGTIMFPSTHDITPDNLSYSIFFLKKLLNEGNKVLIVSKPHFEVIQSLCNEFQDYKKNILFRFTIGSMDSEVLKFWELNAPDYEERKKSLIHAYNNGFATSVSCEPMLDNNTLELVKDLEAYVTDSIWIGKANFLSKRLKMNGFNDTETIENANELLSFQSDNNIRILYGLLCNNPKIKWKESIKKVLNLEISTIKGLDK